MKAKLLKDPKLIGAKPVVGNIYEVVYTKIVKIYHQKDKIYYRLRLCEGIEFSVPADHIKVIK